MVCCWAAGPFAINRGKEGKAERDKANLIKWYNARDMLLAENGVERDINKALQLASDCEHEDAKWLVSLFPDGEPAPREELSNLFVAQRDDAREEMRKIFVACGDDARALYYAVFVHWRWRDEVWLRKSAMLGYAPAQGRMAWGWSTGSERVEWAEKAAAHGDRDGLCKLADCLWKGKGCVKDEKRALQLYKEAAELGLVQAQWCYGERAFKQKDWERYLWWGRSAAQRYNYAVFRLVHGVATQVEQFGSNESGRIMFAVGLACRGHVDMEQRTVFGQIFGAEECRVVERCVIIYDECCTNAKRAIHYWIWAAKKELCLPKDVRLLIAKLVGNARSSWSEKR